MSHPNPENPPAAGVVVPGKAARLDDATKRYSDRLSLYGKFLLKVLLMCVSLGGMIYFAILVKSREYRVLVIQSPKSAVEVGITDEVARRMFANKLSEIQDRSNTVISNRFLTAKPAIDFTVPKTSFSFQTLVQWTKDVLKRPDTVVTADITKENNVFEIHPIVVNGEGRTFYLPAIPGNSVEELVAASAVSVMSALDPLVVGAYEYDATRTVCRKKGLCTVPMFTESIRDLQRAAEYSDPAIYHRAFISLASLYAAVNDHRTAIFYLQTAINRAKNVEGGLDTRLMLGVEYTALGEHAKAAEAFQFVVAHAPTKLFGCDLLRSYAHEDLGKNLVDAQELRNRFLSTKPHSALAATMKRQKLNWLTHLRMRISPPTQQLY